MTDQEKRLERLEKVIGLSDQQISNAIALERVLAELNGEDVTDAELKARALKPKDPVDPRKVIQNIKGRHDGQSS